MENTVFYINSVIAMISVAYLYFSAWNKLNKLIQQLTCIEDKIDKTNTILKINETRSKIEEDLKIKRD